MAWFVSGVLLVTLAATPSKRQVYKVEDFSPLSYGEAIHRSNATVSDASEAKQVDSLFCMDVQTTVGDYHILGVEFDGENFWVSGGNSGTDPNKLYKIDRNGNVLAVYDQPSAASGWGFRDLVFDGEFIYGTADNGLIYQIDTSSGEWTGVTIDGPLSINRGLAYDPATDHFWTANFSSSIYEFDREGHLINVYDNNYPIYGLAWDNITEGAPWLWVAAQVLNDSGGLNVLFKFDPRTGTYTDEAYPIYYANPQGKAGGLAFTINFDPRYATLIEIVQETDPYSPYPDFLLVLSLGEIASPSDPMPPENISAYSDYTTPTSILLRWEDPSRYVNGDSLTDFSIDVYTIDSVYLTSIASGVESVRIYGLTDGTLYQFLLQTRDQNNRTSIAVPSPEWYAGGSPYPAPPTNLSVEYINDTTVRLHWNDPTTQSDGTPLDDLAGIEIYIDTVLTDSQLPGFENKLLHLTAGTHSVFLRAFDDESPRHYSIPSDTIQIFTIGHIQGPDSFGYWVFDSYIGDTVQFDWIEISETGMRMYLDDDDYTSVPLSFRFPFYDTIYTAIQIHSNGVIAFSDTVPADYENDSLPTDKLQDAICGFWTDLRPDYSPDTGGVFFQDFGSFAVIEWKSVPFYEPSNVYNTFEVILYPNGRIKVQFLDIGTPDGETVGIQDRDGSQNGWFLQYSYNMQPTGITDSLAVLFVRPPFHDIGVAALEYPESTVIPGVTVWPLVRLVNFAENPESITVSLTIAYSDSVVYADSAYGFVPAYGDTVIKLPAWTPLTYLENITYSFDIVAYMEDDSNISNNHLTRYIRSTERPYFPVHEIYRGDAPRLDGYLPSNEWADAVFFDISDTQGVFGHPVPPNSVILFLKHDSLYLYFGIDAVGDQDFNPRDALIFYLDDDHDLLWPEDTSEGGNKLSISTQWITRIMQSNGRFGEWGGPRNDRTGYFFITNLSGHVQVEARLPMMDFLEPDPATLGATVGDTFGLFVAYEDDEQVIGFWPPIASPEYYEFPVFFAPMHLNSQHISIESEPQKPGHLSVRLVANPSFGSPKLTFETPRRSKVLLEAFDASGRMVMRSTVSLPNGSSLLELRELSKTGVYFLKVKTADFEKKFKVVVLR